MQTSKGLPYFCLVDCPSTDQGSAHRRAAAIAGQQSDAHLGLRMDERHLQVSVRRHSSSSGSGSPPLLQRAAAAHRTVAAPPFVAGRRQCRQKAQISVRCGWEHLRHVMYQVRRLVAPTEEIQLCESIIEWWIVGCAIKPARAPPTRGSTAPPVWVLETL
jgi:hypothetical protein